MSEYKRCGHLTSLACACIQPRAEHDDEPVFSAAERAEIGAYLKRHWHDEPEPEPLGLHDPSSDEHELRQQIAETAKTLARSEGDDAASAFLRSLGGFCRTRARAYRPRRRP